MLFPQINKARSIIDLNGLWKFKLLKNEADFVPGEELTDFEWLSVPASYNDQKEDRAYRRFAGLSLYQRTFVIPKSLGNERLVLRFDAVTNACKVFIGSQLVTEHKGGYLPFEIDLTGTIEIGTPVLLTVLVDNRVNGSTLPVGNEKGTAFFGSDNAGIPSVEAGKEYQEAINLPNFDFFNYCGINRNVRIYTTPKAFVDDITVITSIASDQTTGLIDYSVDSTSGDVSIALMNREGQVVANASGASGILEVKNASFWWPAPLDPYLYTLCVTSGDDYYELSVGIRTVCVKGTSFLINGRPFYFKGFGKHEDSAIHGRGFDLTLDVKDVGLIHWLGANSFRTSHYPYAEEMYDLCDREGIVIIDETPAVGIGAGGKDPYKTLNIRDHHEDVLRDLIARDKNHPCVVMWSMGNEPDTVSAPESALEYWGSLYKFTHSLDPQGRPVTFVCCQNDYTVDLVTRTMDVVCINRYYGWYNLSGDLDAAMYAMNIELDFWGEIGKPLMFTEYGADTVAGMHATVPEMFSEEYQAEFLLEYGKAFDQRPYIVGEQMWNFADFGTIQGPMRADGNKKGLFTRDRKPKLSAHVIRKRWTEIPNFDYQK